MKQFNVVLSEEGLKNLSVMLNRVDLKGAEVPAYVGIVNALNAAKEIVPGTAALPKAEGEKAAP
jgi:hypothetical protein